MSIEETAAKKPTINIFTEPKKDTDEDLVGYVRSALIDSGLIGSISVYDNHEYIRQASSLGTEAQRFLINKFLRLMLMSASVDTKKQRFYLIDTGSISDWKKCFLEGVLPLVAAQNLLKPI